LLLVPPGSILVSQQGIRQIGKDVEISDAENPIATPDRGSEEECSPPAGANCIYPGVSQEEPPSTMKTRGKSLIILTQVSSLPTSFSRADTLALQQPRLLQDDQISAELCRTPHQEQLPCLGNEHGHSKSSTVLSFTCGLECPGLQ